MATLDGLRPTAVLPELTNSKPDIVSTLSIMAYHIHNHAYLGNVELPCPKLFQAFSVKFTLIFFMSAFIQSFNHSTSAHAKIMHIDAKL